MNVRVVLVALAWALLAARAAAQAPAPVPSDEQRQHFDRGVQRYMAKDYDGAVQELELACPSAPWRECLFAWAQAERLRAHYASAIVLYDRYLATNPPRAQAAAAKASRARCEAALAALARSPAPEPAPPPAPVVRVPEPSAAVMHLRARAERPEPAQTAWYDDTTGDVLGVAGIAGVATGTGFLVVSITGQQGLSGASTQLAFEDRLSRLQTERAIAVTALSVGAACVIAALVHYVWHG